MKWTMRHAALLAALLMALAVVEIARPNTAVATNEDVEFLQPPSDKGDPDDGGPNRIVSYGWNSLVERGARLVSCVRLSLRERFAGITSKPSARTFRACGAQR